MRTIDQVILRTLCLGLAAASLVVACSSSKSDGDPTDDGGVVTPGQDGGGGFDATAPDLGKPCTTGSDCTSGVCGPEKLCLSATSSDFVKNGDETDIDCGGTNAKACETDKGCALPRDCVSGVCTGGKCAAPTTTDGVKNGTETGIDCGGTSGTPCPAGQGCALDADCADKICTGGLCIARKPADGVKNGDETDIDCGGAVSPPCATGLACLVQADCDNVLCTGNVCQPPTTDDGLKNGTESDVDCGGTSGVACAVGKTCTAHGDCASQGCAYNGVCSLGKSCTGQHGGFTCGAGEFGTGGAAHENCCTEIFVNRAAGAGGPYYLDKYLVTAGRMRQFFDRLGGDVKTFVTGNDKFPADWVDRMPSNMAEALANVGPVPLTWDWADGTGIQARGCQVANGGARTYYQADITPTEKNYYPQDALDEKAAQCMNLPLLLAFCLWDNKDLPTNAEITYAWKSTDNRTYPWGASPAYPTQQFEQSDYIVHRKGYMFPGYTAPDSTYNIAAPGRKPLGAGPFGHMDLAGNVFEYARSVNASGVTTPQRFNSGSWENHVPSGSGGTISAAEVWRRYYAFGGRCGHR